MSPSPSCHKSPKDACLDTSQFSCPTCLYPASILSVHWCLSCKFPWHLIVHFRSEVDDTQSDYLHSPAVSPASASISAATISSATFSVRLFSPPLLLLLSLDHCSLVPGSFPTILSAFALSTLQSTAHTSACRVSKTHTDEAAFPEGEITQCQHHTATKCHRIFIEQLMF